MAQMGANLEELASLASTLSRQSQVIQEVTGTVRGRLDATSWHGPAADRFRGEWAAEFEPSLRRLQAVLQDAAAEIGRRRDALMQAGG
jgi:WXG100 family type VII secretion target